MQTDPGDHAALWWVAVGAAIAVATYAALSGFPWAKLTLTDWVGQNGIIGAATGLLAVLGAIAAGFGVYYNNERSKEALSAAQFQKGAELLDSVSDSAAMAGIQLIAAVGLDRPVPYQRIVIRTLRQLMIERNREAIRVAYEGSRPSEEGLSTHSGLIAVSVLGALARIRTQDRWLGMGRDGMLRLTNMVYLERARLLDADLSQFDIRHSAFGATWFVGCRMNSSRVEGRLWSRIRLENCELSDVKFELRSLNGDYHRTPIIFKNCDVANVVINGTREPDRQELAEPLRLEVGGPG